MKRILIPCLILILLPLTVLGQGQDTRYNYLSAQINKYQKQNDYVQENKYHTMAIAYFDSIESQMLQKGVAKNDSLILMIESLIKGHRDMVTVNNINLDFNKYNNKKEEDKTEEELEYEIACLERMLAHLDTASPRLQLRIPFINNTIAIKESHIVTKLIAQEQYQMAKEHISHALKMAQPESKPYYEANKWAGYLFEREARELSNSKPHLQEAIELYKRSEKHFLLAQKQDKALNSKLNRAMCLIDLSKKEEAKRLLNEVKTIGRTNDTLMQYVGEASYRLGQMARDEDRYNDALKLLEEGYTLSKKSGIMHTALMAANELASLYTRYVPNEEMRKLWEKNSRECKIESEAQQAKRDRLIAERGQKYEHKQTDHRIKATVRLTNGMKLVANGRFQEGVDSLSVLAKDIERNDEVMMDLLCECYSSLSNAKMKMKDYTGAEEDGLRALTCMNQIGEVGKKTKATAWYRLSVIYQHEGKKVEAMEAADSCVTVTEDFYGPLHTETLDAYDLRANTSAICGKKERSLNDMAHCFDIVRNNVVHNFAYLTTTERATYWKRFSDNMRKMAVFADGLSDFESEYTDALYEEQLLAKGLLLTAESELRRAISGDATLKNAFEKIRALRKKFLDPQTSPAEGEKALTEADRIERQLGTQASSMHQFMDFLKVGVKDVKAHLPAECAAVEFVDYPGKDNLTKIGALVLLPDKPHVHFIPLVYESELRQKQNQIGTLVWQPILEYIGLSIHDIYFAPTAILYQLPIESATFQNGEFVETASRKLHRVSSTRWLAIRDNNQEGHDAVVYGGLRYDASVAEMREDAKKYEKSETDLLTVTEGKRAALTELDYLKGTLEEADSITNALNKKMTVKRFSEANGTEASFKALSGQRKRIIHIGTHGFYDEESHVSDFESALDRSGLYFAGADNRRFGEDIPVGVEDGVLSAREIEELDLRGLELISLSACETGKGAVNGDGVFGLQRGFKKAGAKSILMSLWKVDDKATCVLMSEFYRNWANGTNLHDALEIAKRKVRGTKGWEDPIFWAAFILLDAF
ncbi:MAG: CHAT domain-containing protein [Bacteroidales bacterium]|nr:CHAT domain-containing protein [Bacteroidales bacterium]